MYDPREDLYGVGPDEDEHYDTKYIYLTSQLATPPASPVDSDSPEAEDGIDFPAYELCKRNQEERAPEQSEEPSPNPSLIVRPVSQASIERPEDDLAARMLPVHHVDYLSHDWNEEDLWATWKHIVSERGAYNNSCRLENASWRSWEKMRRNLKTVSPGSVKWMKDHDVTWLYGPLQAGLGVYTPCKSDDTLRKRRSNSIRQHQKPILKKRSLSELMLRRSVSSASLLRQAATAVEASKKPSRSYSAHDSFLLTNLELTSPVSNESEAATPNPGSWKNVRFYELVEQCMAVANPEDEVSLTCRDSDDEVVVMKSPRTLIRKQSPPSASRSSSPPSRTIEKLPHAPLKSPEAPACDALGISYFPTPSTVSPPTQTSPISIEDEGDNDEDDDWQPPKWFRNRKDSVHLLHDKLDAIKRSIGISHDSKPLLNDSSKQSKTVPEVAAAAENQKTSKTFKLTTFSFTSTRDLSTPALSTSSSNTPSSKSHSPGPIDPAFTATDYFSPRSVNANTCEDDYDWIEAYPPEEINSTNMKIESKLITSSPPYTPQPFVFNSTLLSHDPEKEPVARTSSDSGYGSELTGTLRDSLADQARVRDTYNGTPEIEKEKAICDWDLYPGAWDAMELEEAVAWSRGF